MLKPRTSYKWRVKQWDKNGEEGVWSDYAVFETGIMGKYHGQWIGYPETDKNRNKRDPHPAPMLRKHSLSDRLATTAGISSIDVYSINLLQLALILNVLNGRRFISYNVVIIILFQRISNRIR